MSFEMHIEMMEIAQPLFWRQTELNIEAFSHTMQIEYTIFIVILIDVWLEIFSSVLFTVSIEKMFMFGIVVVSQTMGEFFHHKIAVTKSIKFIDVNGFLSTHRKIHPGKKIESVKLFMKMLTEKSKPKLK